MYEVFNVSDWADGLEEHLNSRPSGWQLIQIIYKRSDEDRDYYTVIWKRYQSPKSPETT